jgi:hypothetical protein
MTLFEIRKIAESAGIALGQAATKLKLIRMIQLSEGIQPCFATGLHKKCKTLSCRWREDCQVRDALVPEGSHIILNAKKRYETQNARLDAQKKKIKKLMEVQIK